MTIKPIKQNILQFFLIFLSLLAFSGSIVYYLYSLDNWGLFFTLILTLLFFFIIVKWVSKKTEDFSEKENHNASFKYIYSSIYIFLYLVCFVILFSSRTVDSIVTPWQVIPKIFFLFYALSTFILFLANERKEKLATFLIILHYILSFSICAVVYIIGYGFDPFVHQATLEIIDKIGAVEPKTFYYLGQYVIELFVNKLPFLSFDKIDKILVPVLSAILIPLTFFKVSKEKSDQRINYNFSIISFLALPFSIFIVTVPQNLSYLFLILIIIFSLNVKNKINLVTIYALSLATLAIHPIVGIPACLFSLLLFIKLTKIKDALKKYLYLPIFSLLALILPILFYLLEKKSNSQLGFGALFSLNNLSFKLPVLPGQENFILNALYLHGFNLRWIIILILLVGVFITFRKNNLRFKKLYLFSSLAMLISYLFTINIPFGYLVDYERSYYSNRLLVVLMIFSLPFILNFLLELAKKIPYQKNIIKYTFLVFLSLLITVSLYFSYPRYDNYFNSHGYSTSKLDIEAVEWIDNDAGKKDYIVLAHQQTSAAALKKFGFKKYYKNNIFYYPIPTGGPLYSVYLDLVEKVERKKIESAMDLTGVDLAYFVINKYWWASEKIIAEAKLESDEWTEIDNNEIFIFKFILSH